MWFGYFTIRVKLHDQWGQRLRISIRRGWTGLPGRSSSLPGAKVEGARDGSWCYHAWRCFTWLLSLSHVGADVDGLAYSLPRPMTYSHQRGGQCCLIGVVLSQRLAMGDAPFWGREAPGSGYLTCC
jgi:hypothetical protein